MTTVTFTGTLAGMTEAQRRTLAGLLLSWSPDLVLHGDAIGADAEFHALALEVGVPIDIYPSTLRHKRAYCEGARRVLEPQPPIVRNHVMVDLSERVIACPEGAESSYPRSGTWATARYGHATGAEVKVIDRQGNLSDYGL